MKPLLTITRGLPSAMGPEIERLRPVGATYALVEWPLPPDDSGEVIGPQAVTVLCRALLRSGHVAFRWDDGAPAAGGTFFAEPRRSSAAKAFATLLGRDATAVFGVLTTGDEAVTRNLFGWGGWSASMQAVLVYDPAADPIPIAQALQHGLDWQGRSLPCGCRLLFGSGHDGGFALAAGARIEFLDRFIADLETERAAVRPPGA